jgi:O-antigen/teichoic acid export membrane protein
MGVRARSLHYFAATAGSSVIAFASLPLTTRILGPPNYGQFALGVTIAGVGATLATLGSGYIINARLRSATREEARSAVSTVAVNAVAIAGSWAILVSALYLLLRGRWGPLGEIGDTSFFAAVAAGLLLPIWIIASEVLTVQGRSALFASIALSQGVVGTAVTLICLYPLDLSGLSLFLGFLAGSCSTFLGGLFVLRRYLSVRITRTPRRELAQSRFLLAQVLDAAHGLSERTLLTQAVGFDRLGLYTHSQAYRAYAFQATKAVGRGLWPVTLREAADPASEFPHTRSVWNAVHVAVTVVGLAMVMLGYVLVGWITNDKFVGAAVFFAPWFILILLQSLARPESAAIYTYGTGPEVARLSAWANVAALVCAVALIPKFGPEGAVVALLAQAIVYRSLIRVTARRYRPIPFQDGWAVFGMFMLTVAFVVDRYFDPELTKRVVFCAVLELIVVVIALPVFREVVRRLRVPAQPSLASSEP